MNNIRYFDAAEVDSAINRNRANEQAIQQNTLLMDRQRRQFAREDEAVVRDGQIRDAYSNSIGVDGKIDTNQLLKNVGQVAPRQAFELSNTIAQRGREDDKFNMGKETHGLQVLAAKAKNTRDTLARVTPETYAATLQGLMQDPDTASALEGAPAGYNPEWVQAQVQDAQSFIQQTQQEAAREFSTSERVAGQEYQAGENNKNRSLTIRGQNISANNAAQSRALQIRGQNLAALATQNKPVPATPGQEAVDKEFAKTVYVPHKSAGGAADGLKLIKQLEAASATLGSDDSLTGPFVGSLPDGIRKYTNPTAINNREQVEEVVQRNLRAVLGAQFTEKEGVRLIARAYNPKLSTEVNKVRVDALTKQMKIAQQTKSDAIQYFEQNGTLTGWQGKMPTMADFETAIDSAQNPNVSNQTILDADAILGL